MEKVLLSAVKILDRQSPHHQQIMNVLIVGKQIAQISPTAAPPPTADLTIEVANAHLSVGWFDMRAGVPAIGLEHKEDLHSASKAATFGGFTELAILPVSNPVVQTKEQIRYIIGQSEHLLTQMHPIAAISTDAKGSEMTEMYDLHTAGAVAFADGHQPLTDTSLLLKTLQYLQQFGGLLINLPDDKHLSKFGQMHEGVSSTMLGLKGLPALAEAMGIQRDLNLLRYAGGKIHFSCLSAAVSVELVRQAKKEGLNVTADVAAHQLAFTDEALADFDTNLKVKPPFRTEQDRLALIEGLLDGTIDAIVTDHQPHDTESKALEFDLAEFGVIGLQTAFTTVNTYAPQLTTELIIEKFTTAPRQILGLPSPTIQEGKQANLTLFNPEQKWIFTEKDIRSKSKNSPFIGKALQGKIIAVFNQGKKEIFN